METQVLKGKVALVTGGNSGIGFGPAKSLWKPERSYTLQVADRNNWMKP